jgi:hypothetical protein
MPGGGRCDAGNRIPSILAGRSASCGLLGGPASRLFRTRRTLHVPRPVPRHAWHSSCADPAEWLRHPGALCFHRRPCKNEDLRGSSRNNVRDAVSVQALHRTPETQQSTPCGASHVSRALIEEWGGCRRNPGWRPPRYLVIAIRSVYARCTGTRRLRRASKAASPASAAKRSRQAVVLARSRSSIEGRDRRSPRARGIACQAGIQAVNVRDFVGLPGRSAGSQPAWWSRAAPIVQTRMPAMCAPIVVDAYGNSSGAY